METLVSPYPLDDLLTYDLVEYDRSALSCLTYDFLREVEDWFASFDQEGYYSHWYLFRKAWLCAMLDGYVKVLISARGKVGDPYEDKHNATVNIFVRGSVIRSELRASAKRDYFELCNEASGFCKKTMFQVSKVEINPIRGMTLSYKRLKPLGDYYEMQVIILDYIEQVLRRLNEEGYRRWGTVEFILFSTSQSEQDKVGKVTTYDM